MADFPAVTRFASVAACCAYRCASDASRGACGDRPRAGPPPLGSLLVGVLQGASASELPGLWPLEGSEIFELKGLLVVRYGTCTNGKLVFRPQATA